MNKEDLYNANNIVDNLNNDNNIKRIKSKEGLIELIELNKVVLTEDNKMLLKD